MEAAAVTLIKGSLSVFRASACNVALELYREVFRAAPAVRCLFSLEFFNLRGTKQCPLRSAPDGLGNGDRAAMDGDDTLMPPLSAQAQILADSIVSFCASVDDIASIEPAIDRICAKHVSRQIQPEHYTVVAEAFSAAIRTVLGEKLSVEELAAWDGAVVFLAGLLIKRESELYKERANTPGVWEVCSLLSFMRTLSRFAYSVSFLLSPDCYCDTSLHTVGIQGVLRRFSLGAIQLFRSAASTSI